MRTLYNFLIRPYNDRYNNTRKIGDNDLIVNSNIEDHKFVSKKAVVVSTPAAFDTDIRTGDIVYVHHNIFRRWYDQKGKERNSSTYFKDDLYFCSLNQIYMYNLSLIHTYLSQDLVLIRAVSFYSLTKMFYCYILLRLFNDYYNSH